MSPGLSLAIAAAQRWRSRIKRLIGRRLGGLVEPAQPPIPLALARRRSQDWQRIDALLETLRQAESGSGRAA